MAPWHKLFLFNLLIKKLQRSLNSCSNQRISFMEYSFCSISSPWIRYSVWTGNAVRFELELMFDLDWIYRSVWTGISVRFQPEYAVGAQIDLLFDRLDNAITVCEIKFTEKQFVIDKAYANILRNKISGFQKIYKTKKQIFLAMICSGGIKKNMYSEDLVQRSVCLEDLFKR
jgi:hypothetical protein